MNRLETIREALTASLAGDGKAARVADRLCTACVDLLDVDGAAISIIQGGVISRSLGSSSQLSGELDELQFTFGEGPCLDAVRSGSPVLVADLTEDSAARFPSFAEAALKRSVRAVFALPISVTGLSVGALDLYRARAGALGATALAGGLIAAELATLPLLDLMGIDLHAATDEPMSDAWYELSSLTRTEVYQALGMVMVQLGLDPTESLLRIRAHAYANDMTASEASFAIIEGQLRLDDDGSGRGQESER